MKKEEREREREREREITPLSSLRVMAEVDATKASLSEL